LGAEILRLKNNKQGETHSASLKSRLDGVYSKYSLIYPDNTSRLGMVNELSYFSRLQIINPLSLSVEAFIKKSNSSMILDDTFSGLFYGYVNNRMSSFNFEKLNRTSYPENSLYRIAQQIYHYLIEPENQINPRHEEALAWLRTTSFYQNYSIEIEESIEKVKGKELTYFLKNLWVLDESSNSHFLEDVFKSNLSEYYLLDFWATWCAPCIQGFKDMKKMQLPKNLMVINLSVDKIAIKDKWKMKANEFGLNNSYLIDGLKSRDFFEIFQLEAIPRYMILDKQFNVINMNMFQPHEPQFLKYLNELTNSN
jgi:thiol-disulfide isomerase/thioredoxin